MLVFNNYFCKNRKSKLHFGDRVTVLNVFLYQTGGSMSRTLSLFLSTHVTCPHCLIKKRAGVLSERESLTSLYFSCLLSGGVLLSLFFFFNLERNLAPILQRLGKSLALFVPPTTN
jgi:hypothetical protein